MVTLLKFKINDIPFSWAKNYINVWEWWDQSLTTYRIENNTL